jgi:hypothetical protein
VLDELDPERMQILKNFGHHVQWVHEEAGVSVISPCGATDQWYHIWGLDEPIQVCCRNHLVDVLWRRGELIPPSVAWLEWSERVFSSMRLIGWNGQTQIANRPAWAGRS